MTDGPGSDPSEPLDVEKEEQRLKDLGEKIDHVKRKAEHDLHPHENDETFIGGNSHPEDEDDTIAPG